MAAEVVVAVATATATEAAVMTEGGWEDPPVKISLSPLLLWVLDPPYERMDIKTEEGMTTKHA